MCDLDPGCSLCIYLVLGASVCLVPVILGGLFLSMFFKLTLVNVVVYMYTMPSRVGNL